MKIPQSSGGAGNRLVRAACVLIILFSISYYLTISDGRRYIAALSVTAVNGPNLGFTRLMAPILFPHLHLDGCQDNPDKSAEGDPGARLASVSMSQNAEDVILFQTFFANDTTPGAFLEIGAVDGVTYSNTYAYEFALGWRGILVEANPINAAKLQTAQRPRSAPFSVAICALHDDRRPGSIEFTKTGGPVATAPAYAAAQFMKDWSFDHGVDRVNVPCVPLQYIIDVTALWDIDLFSLDVEGSERVVLDTVDLSKTNIRVLMVELDGYNPEKDAWVRTHLLEHGFLPVSVALPNKNNEVFVNPNFERVKKERRPLPISC